MNLPNEGSQPSNARRQRRGSYDKSVDSASHGYVDNDDRVLSWRDSVDDSRSQDSSFTERVHHGQYIRQGLCVTF